MGIPKQLWNLRIRPRVFIGLMPGMAYLRAGVTVPPLGGFPIKARYSLDGQLPAH